VLGALGRKPVPWQPQRKAVKLQPLQLAQLVKGQLQLVPLAVGAKGQLQALELVCMLRQPSFKRCKGMAWHVVKSSLDSDCDMCSSGCPCLANQGALLHALLLGHVLQDLSC
jgi:hypothetical protein